MQLTVDEEKAQFMVAIQHWQAQGINHQLQWNWLEGSQQWFTDYQEAYQAFLQTQDQLRVDASTFQLIADFNEKSQFSPFRYSYKRDIKPHLNKQISPLRWRTVAPSWAPGYRVLWSLAWHQQKPAIAVSMFENNKPMMQNCEIFSLDQTKQALEYSASLELQKEHYLTQALRRMASKTNCSGCLLTESNQRSGQKLLPGFSMSEGIDLDVMKVQVYGRK